ncbi:MAG TPA: hypothetical protein VEJ63_11135 [Planctomycetota bacterium]|nr:hypothetical protein [Planctomycetota bacterium]
MAFYRKPRFWIVVGVVLVVLLFVIPPILGVAYRSRVEAEIQKAVNAPVKVGSLAINLLPPGATLSAVEIGSPDPATGDKPLVQVASLRANVSLGTLLGGNTRVTRLSLNGLNLNVSVNDKNESSFTRFTREMPPSDRKVELPIDVVSISNFQLHTWRAGKKKLIGTTGAASIYASGLVLPAPDTLLGRETWIDVDLRGIVLSAPALDEKAAAAPEGSVADGASVASLSLELAQAPNTESPVQVRDLLISQPELARVYTKPGEVPALNRAIEALELAMGEGEPAELRNSGRKGEAPTGTGILIHDMKVSGGRIETRGPDAEGKPAYWRLEDLSVNAKNLAFGPAIKTENGELLVEAASTSTSGPGKLKLAMTKISGGYPKWTCDSDYSIEGVAAPPFNVPAREGTKTQIQKGTVAVQLAGPVNRGKLKFEGSVTLSSDFDVSGPQDLAVKAVRGKPMRPLRVGGTLEKPVPDYPNAVARMLGIVLEDVLVGNPLNVMDTFGGFMDSATGQSIRQARDVLKKVPGIDKVPVLDQIFKSGDDEEK